MEWKEWTGLILGAVALIGVGFTWGVGLSGIRASAKSAQTAALSAKDLASEAQQDVIDLQMQWIERDGEIGEQLSEMLTDIKWIRAAMRHQAAPGDDE